MAKDFKTQEETPEITSPTTAETAETIPPVVIVEISPLEQLINAKVKAGLPRDIAEEVAKNQLAHNAQLEAKAVAEAAAAEKTTAKKTKPASDK